MTRFCEFLVAGLSCFLEPQARDVVIGDLEELNLGSVRSVCELCGLIARQQASFWNDWRPWLALLGIAGLIGVRLISATDALMRWPLLYIRTYLKYGVLYQSGLSLPEELIVWISMAAAVILWSWSAGFAFASLARKTAFFTGALLCAVWLGWNVLATRFILSVSPLPLILLLIPWALFFLPAVWGARRASRCSSLSPTQAIVLAVIAAGVIALVTWTSGWPQAGVERWSEGAIHGGTPWYQRLLPYLLLSWPTVWIAASNFGHFRRAQPKHRILLKSKSRRFEL